METAIKSEPATENTKFIRGLGLLDSTMLVAGSMIGSGIFIVSADIARTVSSPFWLLVAWVVTGLITMLGALSLAELAAMFPRADTAGAIGKQEASEARALGRFLRPAIDRAASVQADKLLSAVHHTPE